MKELVTAELESGSCLESEELKVKATRELHPTTSCSVCFGLPPTNG